MICNQNSGLLEKIAGVTPQQLFLHLHRDILTSLCSQSEKGGHDGDSILSLLDNVLDNIARQVIKTQGEPRNVCELGSGSFHCP